MLKKIVTGLYSIC